ncbi:MAG: hypothetical protein JXA11_02570 [Phycisphaerae bacterium]|nr:hypothetical protein [Phycisphaerae bacterium]
MKRTIPWILPTVLVVLASGCGEQRIYPSPPSSVSQAAVASAEGKDLAVTLRLPKSQFAPGEEVPITILATNRGRDGLRFSASNSAPYQIRLEKYTPLGWEVVKTYPEASAIVLAEWVLQPGEKRTIGTKLLVEPDWPTYENLRLRVNLPGRTDVAPFVQIEVTPEK